MNSRYVVPMLLWAIALSGAAVISALAPKSELFIGNDYSDLASAFLFLNWLGIFSLSIWQNRESEKSAADIKKLQTQGTYSLARHPIYLADMLLSVAIILYAPRLNVLLSSLFVMIMIYFWAGLEEEALVKKFGKKYADYRKKVPKFIPLPLWA